MIEKRFRGINLERTIFESEKWVSEKFTFSQAWIDLIALAYTDDGFVVVAGEHISVKRGQCCVSVLQLSKRWKWSRGRTQRYLDNLERLEHKIEQRKTSRTTIISIADFDMFQSYETTDSTPHRTSNSTTENTPSSTTDDTTEKNISTLGFYENFTKNELNDTTDSTTDNTSNGTTDRATNSTTDRTSGLKGPFSPFSPNNPSSPYNPPKKLEKSSSSPPKSPQGDAAAAFSQKNYEENDDVDTIIEKIVNIRKEEARRKNRPVKNEYELRKKLIREYKADPSELQGWKEDIAQFEEEERIRAENARLQQEEALKQIVLDEKLKQDNERLKKRLDEYYTLPEDQQKSIWDQARGFVIRDNPKLKDPPMFLIKKQVVELMGVEDSE